MATAACSSDLVVNTYGAAVGTGVAVGGTVGLGVGAAMGEAVGTGIGSADGMGIGSAVGSPGPTVGAGIGTDVGAGVDGLGVGLGVAAYRSAMLALLSTLICKGSIVEPLTRKRVYQALWQHSFQHRRQLGFWASVLLLL